MKSKIVAIGCLFVALQIVFSSEIPQMMDRFFENFPARDDEKSVRYFDHGTGGGNADYTWRSGIASRSEPGISVLALSMDPKDPANPWMGPNMNTPNLCHFGTYAARLKIPDASDQPDVGAVVGFFTYYNDESRDDLPNDINENGIHDNSEIDFEWHIADPRIIYIGAYTDYGLSPETAGTDNPVVVTRQISRCINLATGEIYYTKHLDSQPPGSPGTTLTSMEENYPSCIDPIPGFDASAQFHTYGFDWYPERIRWWMLHPDTGDTLVLWDYTGPQERITQKPANLMLNIWHTNNWSVIGNPNATEPPSDIFTVEFDWVSYTPYNNDDSTGGGKVG